MHIEWGRSLLRAWVFIVYYGVYKIVIEKATKVVAFIDNNAMVFEYRIGRTRFQWIIKDHWNILLQSVRVRMATIEAITFIVVINYYAHFPLCTTPIYWKEQTNKKYT